MLLGAKIALKNRQVAIEPTIGCGQTLKLSPVRCQTPSKAPLSSAAISSGKAVTTEVADFDPGACAVRAAAAPLPLGVHAGVEQHASPRMLHQEEEVRAVDDPRRVRVQRVVDADPRVVPAAVEGVDPGGGHAQPD